MLNYALRTAPNCNYLFTYASATTTTRLPHTCTHAPPIPRGRSFFAVERRPPLTQACAPCGGDGYGDGGGSDGDCDSGDVGLVAMMLVRDCANGNGDDGRIDGDVLPALSHYTPCWYLHNSLAIVDTLYACPSWSVIASSSIITRVRRICSITRQFLRIFCYFSSFVFSYLHNRAQVITSNSINNQII